MAYHCTVSRTYGAQFTSNKYKEFAQIYGFEHTTPSPYWSYNGKAKAAKKKDAKPTLKKSHDIHLVLLNIRYTPPFGHSFSPAQRRMGRSTQSTLPTHGVILIRKPDPPDQLIVYAEISRHKKACKTQYNKHMNTDLPLLPLGSQLRPAAPPRNNLQQPPALSITQPSFLGPPTTSWDLNLQELDQWPAATFTKMECQPSQPPTMPQPQGTEVGAVSPEAALSPPTKQQITLSGRPKNLGTITFTTKHNYYSFFLLVCFHISYVIAELLARAKRVRAGTITKIIW